MPVHLTTPRLLLRPFTLEDVDFIVDLNSSEEVWRYTGDGPLDRDEAAGVVRYIHARQHPHGMARLVVVRRSDGRRLGWCGLRRLEPGEVPDLGYRFFVHAWGQGYATESATAVLDHGFSLATVDRVRAEAYVPNHRSLAVMAKLGMVEVERSTDEGLPTVIQELTETRWRARQR